MGRPGYPLSHWQLVADVVRLQPHPRGRHRSVMRAFRINAGTAYSWIRKCIHLGLLPRAR